MLTPGTYHAHIYFDAAAKATAQRVAGELAAIHPVEIGTFHDKPVGPHPIGSCQVTVEMKDFGAVIDWLARNRDGLTMFIHPNTGDVMADHTAHAIWMGEMMDLDLVWLGKFIKARSRAM